MDNSTLYPIVLNSMTSLNNKLLHGEAGKFMGKIPFYSMLVFPYKLNGMSSALSATLNLHVRILGYLWAYSEMILQSIKVAFT